jgi:hypothetical protein
MDLDFLYMYESYLTLFGSLAIAVIISFREQIQEVELVNKLFGHFVFRVLMLITIVYISNLKSDLMIPLILFYLILNTYVVNLPNVKDESNYTSAFGYNNDDKDTDKDKTDATLQEPESTTTQNENFKTQSELMDGEEIGNILTQVNKLCTNKHTTECQKVMNNYKVIDNNTKEIVNVYNEIVASKDDNNVEKVIEKYKNIY